MRISVVIATKDRARCLERALQSLGEQVGHPEFEVVVVDNASTDTTPAVVARLAAASDFPIRYLYEGEPNRGKARNRGVAVASGFLILFVDDDVQVPPAFIAAHEAAHTSSNLVANGPIINVASYDERPKPTIANASRAFLCTCNVSIPKHALDAVGGFDEDFNLYGWEDTELGVRLREHGLRRTFAWDAYLWHIKSPADHTLEVETRKALERARMATRFLAKASSRRVRLATGAHPLNLLRARFFTPEKMLAIYAGLATEERVPAWLRSLARTQFLDGMYSKELLQELKRDH